MPTLMKSFTFSNSGPLTINNVPGPGDRGAARLVFNGGSGLLNVTSLTVSFDGSGAVDRIRGDSNPVSEPTTLGLLSAALLGFGITRRRRRA